MKSGINYRRPVEILSAGWGCVISSLSGSFTDSDSVCSYYRCQVASRSHAYYWKYTLRMINRCGSARLDVKYVAHVHHFIWICHILFWLFLIIFNSPHRLLFPKLFRNNRHIPGHNRATYGLVSLLCIDTPKNFLNY